MSENVKPVTVGDTKKINDSYYVLVPKKQAKQLGIIRRTPWKLTVDGNALTYHFQIASKPQETDDVR